MQKGNLNNKFDFENGNFFIEYFYNIGINQELIYEDFLYTTNLITINDSLKILPTVISKFPPIKKNCINVEDSVIIKHCFPNGYKIIQSESKPSNELYSFTLGNLNSETHPVIYFNCFLFYENLENYSNLKQKYDNFESDQVASNKIQNSFRVSSLSSKLIPQVEHHDSILIDKEQGLITKNLDVVKSNENSDSPFKKSINRHHSGNVNLSCNLKKIYCPKIICFSSFYAYRYEHSKILKTIYNYTFNSTVKLKKPLEKILENLVLETPIPPQGIYKIEYKLFNEKYILTQPPPNSLPLVSLEMEKIFFYLKVEQTLDIYKHILLEDKVLFFSESKNALSNIIESFISLLYPFKYVHPYISILPIDSYCYIDMFKSYVFGINLSYRDNFFKEFNIEENSNILIVDLDEKKCFYIPRSSQDVQVCSLDELSQRNQYEGVLHFIDIPKRNRLKLYEKIKNYIKEIKENSSKEGKDNFIKVICEFFYNFNVRLLKDYSKYLISTTEEFEKINDIINSYSYYGIHKELDINKLFKVEEFYENAIYQYDKLFYKHLFGTSMFYNFIMQKLFPKNNQEKMEIIFFDESIAEKQNKRIFAKNTFTPFMHSNLYEIRSTYFVPNSKCFSKSELEFLKSSQNLKQALRYGQEISHDENNSQITIIYHIFPKLLYDNSFFEYKCETYQTNKILLRTNLQEEVDKVSKEMLSNKDVYYIYSNTNYKLNNMENYVYICWIYLFATTFYNLENGEKPFRFQQLLDVIKKDETKNLLFQSLIKYGDDTMCIKLYEVLYKKRLITNYTHLALLINKLTASNQSYNILNNKKKNSVSSVSSRRSNICIILTNSIEYYLPVPTYVLKKRTIFNDKKCESIDFDSIEELTFEIEDLCIDCNQIIDVETLSLDFKNMKKGLFWAQCPHCLNNIIPKLGIKISRDGLININYEKIVMYSPQYLKENNAWTMIKENDHNIDLEEFKSRYHVVFWNSLWYFNLMHLPYDFILPYKRISSAQSIIVVKDKSYKNLEICSEIVSLILNSAENKEPIYSIISNYTSNIQEIQLDCVERSSFINIENFRHESIAIKHSQNEIFNSLINKDMKDNIRYSTNYDLIINEDSKKS